jgi:hypothetical protein
MMTDFFNFYSADEYVIVTNQASGVSALVPMVVMSRRDKRLLPLRLCEDILPVSGPIGVSHLMFALCGDDVAQLHSNVEFQSSVARMSRDKPASGDNIQFWFRNKLGGARRTHVLLGQSVLDQFCSHQAGPCGVFYNRRTFAHATLGLDLDDFCDIMYGKVTLNRQGHRSQHYIDMMNQPDEDWIGGLKEEEDDQNV